MKSKLTAITILFFLLTKNSFGQYKDLEGVFFGKLIAIGVGGGLSKYTDKNISGTNYYFTPLEYSVIFDSKHVSSIRASIYGNYTVNSNLVDWNNNSYSQVNKFKLYDISMNYRFSLTKNGIERPFSIFFNLPMGVMFGKQKTTDSRNGDLGETQIDGWKIGAGLTFFQRLGSRFMVFAEPTYNYILSEGGAAYIGDETAIKFSHYNLHAGVLFLIGKKE
jgi:hypothetical protein